MEEASTDINQEFKQRKNDRIYATPAKRLKEKLSPLISNVDKYQRRWFWELVQNACDYNDEVEIELTITEDKVVFTHNGKPFSMEDALNLVFPDSAKDDIVEADVIGQFGTGFLSTHILSACIDVEGQVQSENKELYNFNFRLDRSDWENRELLSKALRKSEQEFEAFTKADANSNKTTFTYYKDHTYDFVDFGEVLKSGVKFINSTLPYIFAFIPKLNKVTINAGELTLFFTAERDHGKTIVNRKKKSETAGTEEMVIVVYTSQIENTAVACLVKDGKILRFKEQQAKLFCGYPLIGSEEFPFPVVLNSLHFRPKTERDGIELSENDSVNRSVLLNGVLAYESLLNSLIKDNVSGFYEIVNVGKLNFSDLILKWYDENIRLKIKEIIKEKILIDLPNGARVPFKDVLFPVIDKKELEDEFYSLVLQINWCIPKKDELKHWLNNISFSVFTFQRLNFERMFEIHRSENKFPHLFLIDGVDKEKWYYDGLKLIISADKVSLLQKNKFIPMQDGGVKSLEEEMYWDGEIDNQLKDIYLLVHNKDYRHLLLGSNLDFGDALLPSEKTKTSKDISDAIDAAFEQTSPEMDDNYLDGLEKLLTYTEGWSEDEVKFKFPRFQSNRGGIVMQTFTSDEKRSRAFKLIRSDKLEALSKLADSSMSSVQIEQMIEQSSEFEQFLAWKNSFVDDEENADEVLGDIGEKIVLKKLEEHFSVVRGYEVEWVAKTRKEPNYDFEVRHNGIVKHFVDAKTTGKGLANTNTVPFFMRTSQWQFLPTIPVSQSYIIARVFYIDEIPDVRFLKIENQNI